MAQLIVRNIEDEVAQKLKERAAKNGVSAEEEHRRILAAVLNGKESELKKSFKEHLMSMPDVGTDEDFARPKDYGREIDFSD